MNQSDLYASDPAEDLLYHRERLMKKLAIVDDKLATMRAVEVPMWASKLLASLSRVGVSGWWDQRTERVLLGGGQQAGGESGSVMRTTIGRAGEFTRIDLGPRGATRWRNAVLRAVLEAEIL